MEYLLFALGWLALGVMAAMMRSSRVARRDAFTHRRYNEQRLERIVRREKRKFVWWTLWGPLTFLWEMRKHAMRAKRMMPYFGPSPFSEAFLEKLRKHRMDPS